MKQNIISNLSFFSFFILLFLASLTFIAPLDKIINISILFFLFVMVVIVKYRNIQVPTISYFVIFGYLLLLIFSYKNTNLLYDIKFQITLLVGLFIFIQFNSVSLILEKIYYICFVLSIITFLLYLSFYFHFIPNIYTPEDTPLYKAFRIDGPDLNLFLIIPFIYASKKFTSTYHSIYFYINFILGLLSSAFSGSNQVFILIVLFHIIALIRLNIKTYVMTILFSVLIYMVYPYILDDEHQQKISQITDPLRADSSILCRITDFAYAYDSLERHGKLLFGEGVGVDTEVARFSQDGKNFGYYSFLEIDNGFFYVLHRTGYTGLVVFSLIILSLIYRYGSFKNKIMYLIFFIVTNLLSIHFFVHQFSIILTYLLIRSSRV